MRAFVAVAVLLAGTTIAAPPSEVPRDAIFQADGVTLSWSAPAGGADSYDVYQGSSPAEYDHNCRLTGTTVTQASLVDTPSPDSLFFYLVGAVNTDGAGSLGADSGGTPIPNSIACLDLDGDQAPDNLDNCPSITNATQADQDANGVGDRCDPNSYDFEADTAGLRPLDMTQSGETAALTTADISGDLSTVYSGATTNSIDTFDRLPAGLTRQDVTAYVDFDDVSASGTVELWSEGAASWDSGAGLALEIDAGRQLTLHQRLNAADAISTIGPVIPNNGRLRLRLIKGANSASQLHVDSWDGAAFIPDFTVFDVANDDRLRGLGTALSSRNGGARGIKRVTIVHEIPPGTLTLRSDPSWSMDWKLFQRNASNEANIPLKFFYRYPEAVRAQARVVTAGTTSVLSGHDYGDHEILLTAALDGAAADLIVIGVPGGGNYDVQLRLLRDADSSELATATLNQIAVGDVFVAGGQSNMSGRGGFSGLEQRINEVHMFHNDGLWKKAEEPVDDKIDQVDRISFDQNVGHSLILRFAKEVRAAVGVPIGIIPGPIGGSNIETQWQRNESDRDNRGTMYGSLLYRTQIQNYDTPIRGFIWYQGEADVGRTVAQYKADLEKLIADVREDYGDPSLPFIEAQLATYSGQPFELLLSIQEAQRQVAYDDPNTRLVTTIDQLRGDQVHLIQDALKQVGVRFAEAARLLIYGESITPLLELIEARRTIGGSEIELLYDGNLTGGDHGLYAVTDAVGSLNVNLVTVTGSIVSLTLDRPLQGSATVSYGYSDLPTAAWIEDLQGVPVALFYQVPVTP
jgi:hypothetical protein